MKSNTQSAKPKSSSKARRGGPRGATRSHGLVNRRPLLIAAVVLAFGTVGVLATLLIGAATQPTACFQPIVKGQVVTLFSRQFQALESKTGCGISYKGDIVQFKATPGDYYYSTDRRQRSELREYPSPVRNPSQPIDASFDFRVISDLDKVGTDWIIINQIHQNRPTGADPNSSRQPALSMGYGRAGFHVTYRYESPTNPTGVVGTTPWRTSKLGTDKWANVRYHAKLGDGNGELVVWVDGVRVVNLHNIRFGYPNQGQTTWPKVQFGIYTAAINSELVILQKNVSISRPTS